MSLFLKHIARSLRTAPWQPLLILLTVVLSVMLSETAVCLSGAFVAYERKEALKATAAGDLEITARADSSSRFLFAEQAQEVLGEDGSTLGEFVLTAFIEQNKEREALSVSAVDLSVADDFYDFQYLSYGRFDSMNVDRAAVVSQELAERLGLSVGDSLSMRMLGTDLDYEVQAIAAKTGLLLQRDILISHSGVVQLLAEQMPLISTLGDSFAPCTRLMIKLNDPAVAKDIQQRLFAHPDFKGCNITNSAENGSFFFFTVLQICFVWLFVLLILVLSVCVIATSLTLLHRQRAADYRLFAIAGASPRQLHLLLYTESMLYAIVGGILGALLAIPAVSTAGGFYAWQHEILRPSVGSTLFGLLLAPILMLLCTVLHLHRSPISGVNSEAVQPKDSKTKRIHWEWLVPIAILALCLILLVALPVENRILPALVAVFALLLLLYLSFPLFLRELGRLGAYLLSRVQCLGNMVPVLKNLHRQRALHHAGRLLALFLALLFTLFTCQAVFSNQISMMTEDVPADFFAAHVSEQTERLLREDTAVAECVRMTYLSGVTLPNNTTAIAISLSGDTASWSAGGLAPTQMPAGRQVALSKGLAAKCGKQIGDSITLEVHGASYDFVVSDIMAINANFLYFDSLELGIARDMLCIRMMQGADTVAAEERITALLESHGAMMTDLQAVFGSLPSSFEGHLQFMRYGIVFSFVLGLLGCINLFAQQYHIRGQERRILYSCGMTRAGIRRMTLYECLFTALLSLLLGVLSCGILCLLIDAGMRAFGLVLLL